MADKSNSRRVESSIKCTRFLGRLCLIAGVFRELEVDKLIDEKLPNERYHKFPHSICILAMVLNGLGFLGQRLYLFLDYLGLFL
ncbi:transposase [Methanosarcina barkeri CM1]|uniref:Transposase n=1 Tax=Methanosarcina barkeri CM1 TaxID=796385 RepID=A0A0G3CBY5_METBA|nr:transposase [Methanosarcina barkeri CM1]